MWGVAGAICGILETITYRLEGGVENEGNSKRDPHIIAKKGEPNYERA